jgi:hypothetical protein
MAERVVRDEQDLGHCAAAGCGRARRTADRGRGRGPRRRCGRCGGGRRTQRTGRERRGEGDRKNGAGDRETVTVKGVPLRIQLTVVDKATCTPRSGAAVYLWHCDAVGNYSMYSSGVTNENFLRGVQVADSAGRSRSSRSSRAPTRVATRTSTSRCSRTRPLQRPVATRSPRRSWRCRRRLRRRVCDVRLRAEREELPADAAEERQHLPRRLDVAVGGGHRRRDLRVHRHAHGRGVSDPTKRRTAASSS